MVILTRRGKYFVQKKFNLSKISEFTLYHIASIISIKYTDFLVKLSIYFSIIFVLCIATIIIFSGRIGYK